MAAWTVPRCVKPGGIASEFTYVADFLPTVLDIAGIPLPGDEVNGKKLIRPTGTGLLPYLEGSAPSVHSPDEAIGFEGTGGQALFKGCHKLMRNGDPFSDGTWRLYKLSDDPTESKYLSASMPERVKEMLAEVEAFNAKNGVVVPPAGYNPLLQLLVNNWQVPVRQMGSVLAVAIAVVVGVLWALVCGIRRWRRRAAT